MSYKEWTQKIKPELEFNELEAKITDVFNQTHLSDMQKKDLIMEIIKNQSKNPVEFKLYPTSCDEDHKRYRTKDEKYSLIVAYSSFRGSGWYFYVANDPNVPHSYNSLREGKLYKTEEECVEHAESWLSKVMNQ